MRFLVVGVARSEYTFQDGHDYKGYRIQGISAYPPAGGEGYTVEVIKIADSLLGPKQPPAVGHIIDVDRNDRGRVVRLRVIIPDALREAENTDGLFIGYNLVDRDTGAAEVVNLSALIE